MGRISIVTSLVLLSPPTQLSAMSFWFRSASMRFFFFFCSTVSHRLSSSPYCFPTVNLHGSVAIPLTSVQNTISISALSLRNRQHLHQRMFDLDASVCEPVWLMYQYSAGIRQRAFAYFLPLLSSRAAAAAAAPGAALAACILMFLAFNCLCGKYSGCSRYWRGSDGWK